MNKLINLLKNAICSFLNNKIVKDVIIRNVFIQFLVFLALFILFKPIFEKFITDYLINYLFENFNTGIESITVLCVLSLVFFGYLFYKCKIKFSFSSKIGFSLLLLVVIYAYYRLCETELKWDYFLIGKSKILAYSDFTFLLIFYPVTGIIRYFRKSKKALSTNKYFVEDIPLNEGLVIEENIFCIENSLDKVKTEDSDNLRDKFAKDLAEKITKQSFTYSFSIGIVGTWGAGKTSFINSIISYLNKNDTIIVNADPRYNHDEKNIIINFFDRLSSSLRIYDSGLSKKFEEYKNNLMNIDEGGVVKIINSIINLISNNIPSTAKEQYDEINKSITKIGRKLIVIIDDLDRLNAEEIMEVFRLIRNTANFTNTIFILAYDKDYIIKTISNKITYRSKSYLEKFTQLEFYLSNIDYVDLGNIFYDYVEKILSDDEKEILKDALIRNDDVYKTYSILHRNLIHYRDALLFANLFLFEYPQLREDVYIPDLIHLEILKLKFYPVYSLLATRYNDFLSIDHNAASLSEPVYVLNTRKNKDSITGDDYELEILDYVRKGTNEYNYDINEIIEIFKILISLFPADIPNSSKDIYIPFTQIKKTTYHLSIRRPDKFSSYFKLYLTKKEISEKDFNNIFTDYEKFEKDLKTWLNEEKDQSLLSKMSVYFKTVNEEKNILSLIDALFYLVINSKKSDTPFKVIKLLIEQIPIITENLISYEKLTIYIVAKYLSIDYARAPYLFESHLIYNLLKRFENKDEAINSRLKEILFQYYRRNTDESDTLGKINFHLFRYNYELYEDKEKVRNILINFINNKALREFISNSAIEEDIYISGKYKLSEFIEKLFGSYSKFATFINKFKTDEFVDENFMDEFSDFYNLCEITEFKDYIRYDFEKIEISSPKGMRDDGKNIKQIFVRLLDKRIIDNFKTNNYDKKGILVLLKNPRIYLSGKVIMFEEKSSRSVNDFFGGIGRTLEARVPDLSNELKDVKYNLEAKNKGDALIVLDKKPLIEIISIQPIIK